MVIREALKVCLYFTQIVYLFCFKYVYCDVLPRVVSAVKLTFESNYGSVGAKKTEYSTAKKVSGKFTNQG